MYKIYEAQTKYNEKNYANTKIIQRNTKKYTKQEIYIVTTKYKKIQNINHDFCRNEIENKQKLLK